MQCICKPYETHMQYMHCVSGNMQDLCNAYAGISSSQHVQPETYAGNMQKYAVR